MRVFRSYRVVLFALALAALLIVPGASLLYESSAGESCARCHEIRPSYDVWRNSSHRSINCKQCHGGLLTANVSFHLDNFRRVVTHWSGELPERIRLMDRQVDALVERCRSCHRQEFAQWQAGPHSATYSRIFLDKDHNRKRRLIDDCLRCHGMLFDGGIQDVVEPINTTGPWRLKDPRLANRPVIPCLACHSVHREGSPLPVVRKIPAGPAVREEIVRPSLALFDIRRSQHMPALHLPLPQMREGARLVKMSPDARQGLCYQCHAPLADRQVGSGDDRTPIGVHEGLSCLACHSKHSQQTRASCANCHPRLSNCGLDVEKMDTTFVSPNSKHNIHWVKCADCHPKGVPAKRRAAQPVAD